MLQKDNRRLNATIDQLKASTKENTVSTSFLRQWPALTTLIVERVCVR